MYSLIVQKIEKLAAFRDDRGNEIIYAGSVEKNISILFRGSNNRLIVSAEAKIGFLRIDFDCDNGTFEVGSSKGGGLIRVNARVGQDARVTIGSNVTMTSNAYISSLEGSTVEVGRDVMFATGIQVRADDAHPIFDVRTGSRVNVTKDISIGSHVWLGNGVSVLGGADIGDGSVIGLGSMVNRRLPNNVIAAGTPAKVVRKHIAWERPHLSLAKPYYKPDASTVKRSEQYWNETLDDEPARSQAQSRRLRSLTVRVLRGIANKIE